MSLSALDVLSGTLAGWAVTAVGHPFETIKLRLQTQPSPPHAIYKSGMDAARQTLARDGIKGFYVGVASPIAGQTIFRSALFAVNGAYTRARLAIPGADGQKRKSLSYVEYAAGGSIAWSICTLIECPINVAATQLQVQTVRTRLAAAEAAVRITATIPGNVDAVAQSVPQPPPSPLYRGVAHYLRTAPAAHGLRASLFVGLVPHALRNAIGGALHFGAFEATRRTIAEARGVPVERVGLATNMVRMSAHICDNVLTPLFAAIDWHYPLPFAVCRKYRWDSFLECGVPS